MLYVFYNDSILPVIAAYKKKSPCHEAREIFESLYELPSYLQKETCKPVLQ